MESASGGVVQRIGRNGPLMSRGWNLAGHAREVVRVVLLCFSARPRQIYFIIVDGTYVAGLRAKAKPRRKLLKVK